MQPLKEEIPTPSKTSNSASLLSASQFEEERNEYDVFVLADKKVEPELEYHKKVPKKVQG